MHWLPSRHFPGRTLFHDMPVVTLDALRAEYDQVLIVDVRSAYDYNTLHIKDAVKIPVNKLSFNRKLQALTQHTANRSYYITMATNI